ncbi:polyprenol monophosphomannose synthase [bacterium]|nr:polyprenol monophosphomannose synthase [bacterium]
MDLEMAPLLSIVIPTYNEKENIGVLAEKIFNCTHSAGMETEIIVVDDNSPDGTAQYAESLDKRYNVRVIKREGKLGLSSAVIRGWEESTGEILGVIDADLSHDTAILPDMIYSITHGGADIAMGSRYIKGGGVENWPWFRRITSLAAVVMGWLICPVNDVTSGYMLMKRSVFQEVAPRLDPIGFKINLEVLVKGNYKTVTEVPFIFRDRQKGNSKFNGKEIYNYLIHLAKLTKYWFTHFTKHTKINYTPFPRQ